MIGPRHRLSGFGRDLPADSRPTMAVEEARRAGGVYELGRGLRRAKLTPLPAPATPQLVAPDSAPPAPPAQSDRPKKPGAGMINSDLNSGKPARTAPIPGPGPSAAAQVAPEASPPHAPPTPAVIQDSSSEAAGGSILPLLGLGALAFWWYSRR